MRKIKLYQDGKWPHTVYINGNRVRGLSDERTHIIEINHNESTLCIKLPEYSERGSGSYVIPPGDGDLILNWGLNNRSIIKLLFNVIVFYFIFMPDQYLVIEKETSCQHPFV